MGLFPMNTSKDGEFLRTKRVNTHKSIRMEKKSKKAQFIMRLVCLILERKKKKKLS